MTKEFFFFQCCPFILCILKFMFFQHFTYNQDSRTIIKIFSLKCSTKKLYFCLINFFMSAQWLTILKMHTDGKNHDLLGKTHYVRDITKTLWRISQSNHPRYHWHFSWFLTDREKSNGQLDIRDHIQKNTSFNQMKVLKDKKLKFHYPIIYCLFFHMSPQQQSQETFDLDNTSLNLHLLLGL